VTLKAVLFDLGGTLVYRDTRFSELIRLGHQAVAEFLISQGYTVQIDEAVKVANELYNAYHTFTEKSYIELDFKKLYSAIFYQLGITNYSNEELITGAITCFYSSIVNDYYITNDVKEVLSTLKKKGLKLGLVTDNHSADWAYHLLHKFDLEPFFDSIVVSSQIGIRKPHKQIFLHCLKLLNVSNHDSIFVGDSLSHDIQGAENADIKSVWLNRKSERQKSEIVNPNYELNNLSEFLDIIL
jgi:HAD superfamily hydrolase (TIGR01509 family)